MSTSPFSPASASDCRSLDLSDPLDMGIAAMVRDSIAPEGRKVREIVAYGVANPVT